MGTKNSSNEFIITQTDKSDLLKSLHNLYLETLRHREQEIFRYLAILVPAVGGFVWLLIENVKDDIFIVGAVGVILLLFLGAIYSASLGYNYRYLIILLAKLEVMIGVKDAVLIGWPRNRRSLINKNKFIGLPWCKPPEIINVFRWAFIFGIIGVTITSYIFQSKPILLLIIILLGTICVVISFLSPLWFGFKIRGLCNEEPDEWTILPEDHSGDNNSEEETPKSSSPPVSKKGT
jgi:hypothetical protein